MSSALQTGSVFQHLLWRCNMLAYWLVNRVKSQTLHSSLHPSVILILSFNNIVSFCFMCFKALSLALCTLKIIISLWWTDSFNILNEKSLFYLLIFVCYLLIFLILKSIFTMDDDSFDYCLVELFHLFTLNMYVSLHVKWISSRWCIFHPVLWLCLIIYASQLEYLSHFKFM